ncbi:MAG: UvrD-helicase domain-containing protein [Candidatus Cloacimonadota bacterium]|nr:UvrD-helicase domain-containing protein [Candidatus Cloacimonadota bacterium]
MKKQISPKKELDISTNTFITAGAGAGKTTLLTDRFCEILDFFAKKKLSYGIENILVITFTQKAAAEMKRRIFDKISGNTNEEQKYNFKNITLDEKEIILEEFPKNYISTIDAFCSKIVRQHPLKAKIDPNYDILTESESTQIKNEIINKLLKDIAISQNNELKNILQFWDGNKIRLFLKYALNNFYKFKEYSKKLKNKSLSEISQDSLNNNSPENVDSFIAFLKNKSEFFAKYASLKINSPIIDICKNTFNDLKKVTANTLNLEKQSILKRILKELGNKDKYYTFTSSHQLGKKSVWEEAGLLGLYKNIKLQKIAQKLEENFPYKNIKLLHSETDKQASILISNLCPIFEKVAKKSSDWKQINQKFEYEDILQKTIRLLNQKENIRKKLANQFQYILVDEFQDTNYPQWELIKLLSTEKNGQLSKKKIFLVYDEKQSIYRFRGSDITVIQKAKKETKIPKEQIFNISDNYRSNTNLVKCFNFMFKKVFPTKKEFDFEAELQIAESKAENQFPGFVDVALMRKDESATDYENTCIEAQLVGSKIQEYQKFKPEIQMKWLNRLNQLNQLNQLPSSTSSTKKPFFAILVDSRRKFVIYQHILRTIGIDCELIGGTGFFQTQEVYDIFNLLSFLVNSNDEIALVGILRSPLFCFSDNDIFKISHLNGDGFLQKLRNFDKSVPDILNNWRNLCFQMPLDKFLEYIERERFLDYTFLEESSKGQKLANFEKLKSIASRFSKDGKGIYVFLKYLSEEIEVNTREPYSEIPVKSEVVIMTIHQAKGLQFPVVIIPDISHKPKFSLAEPFLIEKINGKIELGVSIYDNFNKGKRTVILNKIKSEIDAQESAERKRLFYVACTRSQSILCFVCQTDGKIKKKNVMDYSAKTWYEYLIDIFDIENLDFPENSQNSPLKISSSVIDKNNLPVLIKTYNIEKKLEKKVISNVKKINYEPPEDRFLQFPKIIKFSVTDIINAGAAAAAVAEAAAVADNTRSIIDSAKLGTAFHYLLQLGILEINPENEDKIKNYLNYLLKVKKPEIYISELNQHLQNVRNSELFNILNQKEKFTILPEFEVRYTNQTKNGIYWELSAKIDLLYQDNQCKWHLIDYKTNNGNSPEAITKFHRYDIQIQFYIYLLKKRFGVKVSSARIYYSYFNKFQNIELTKDEILEDLIKNYIASSFSSLPDFSKEIGKEYIQVKKKTLCQYLPRGKALSGDSVADSYSGNNLVILTPNRSIAREINSMTKRPYIRAFRVQDYLTNLLQGSLPNLIDNKTNHLIQKKIIQENTKISLKNLPGITDSFEQAMEIFYQNDKDLNKTSKLFRTLYNSYNNYLETHNLQNAYDIYYLLFSNSELISKTDFHLLGKFYFDEFPIWGRILDLIRSKAKSFSVIPDSDNLSVEISCCSCINQQDEIIQTAEKVFQLLKKGININEIKIVLTDYKKYFPILENIFPQYGIRYKTAKGKKLKSSPIYTLLDNIFNLLFEPYSFENIFKLFNNSFANCETDISLIDRFVRKNNLASLEGLIKNPNKISDYCAEQNEIDSIHKLANIINSYFVININKKCEPEYFHEKIKNILNYFCIDKYFENDNTQQPFYKENKKSYEIILDLFENLVKTYQRLKISDISVHQLYDDFRDWSGIVEYKLSDEYEGVNILGAWESINHKAKYCFILGMAEEVFPGIVKKNFLIQNLDINKRKLKRNLFIHWQKNYNEITFLYPEKDVDGNQLQKSSFMSTRGRPFGNDIPEIKIDETEKIISRKEYFQDLIRNEERIVFQNNKILERLSKRNIEVKENSLSKFEGKIDGSDLNINHYNASDINLLARCPMRYLFQNILSLTELKRIGVEFERRDWGIFVHKVLESFGKGGGFNKNLQQAFTLMKQKANEQIDAFHYDMNNMFIRKEYEKYVSGLDNNNNYGILRNFLETDFKAFPEFRPIDFEKSFGIDDENFLILDCNGKKIHISGRIDRIDKFKDNKSPTGDKYIIYDYKIGRENTFKLIKENIEFQLPIYYLKSKDEFSDGIVICAFWNLIDGNPSAFLGDISEIDLKSRKRHILIVDKSSIIPVPADAGIIGEGTDKNGIAINNIISAIKELDRKVNSGEFHYTILKRDKAHCDSCGFRKICRYDEKKVGLLKSMKV